MKPVYILLKQEAVLNLYLGEKFIPKHKVSIIEVEEIEKVNGVYSITEYTKYNNKILTIGILDYENCTTITLKQGKEPLREMHKYSENLWIFQQEYKWIKEFKRYEPIKMPFGINQCGEFSFEGRDDKGNLINTFRLKVKPSLLTEEEYGMMIDDLLTMTDQLSQLNGSDGTKIQLLDLEELNYCINGLKETLLYLNLKPVETLISQVDFVNCTSQKKINYKQLIQQEIFPHKNMVKSIVTQRSIYLPENSMIRGALLELLSKFERHQLKEQQELDSFKKQFHYFKSSSGKLINNSKQDKNVVLSFENKLNQLNSMIDRNSIRMKIWEKIIHSIHGLLELDILCYSHIEDLEETHLFQFNPHYIEIYDLINLLNIKMNIKKEVQYFQNDLVKTPHLYEKWIFIKFIYILVEKFNFRYLGSEKSLLENLIIYFNNKEKSFSGYSISLQNQNKMIRLFYEPDLKGMKPDIGMKLISNNKYITGFLDAKYKPYSELKDQLEKDIKHSAIRYKTISDKGCFAFLIHPDQKCNSQFEYSRPHEYGYCFLKPGKEDDFHLLINMILHFHAGWDELCPDCGRIAVSVSREIYKKHYCCEVCKTFWVQNSCWNYSSHEISYKKKNDLQKSDNYLYKYGSLNYHQEELGDWDVHCPRCGKSFKDRYSSVR